MSGKKKETTFNTLLMASTDKELIGLAKSAIPNADHATPFSGIFTIQRQTGTMMVGCSRGKEGSFV